MNLPEKTKSSIQQLIDNIESLKQKCDDKINEDCPKVEILKKYNLLYDKVKEAYTLSIPSMSIDNSKTFIRQYSQYKKSMLTADTVIDNIIFNWEKTYSF